MFSPGIARRPSGGQARVIRSYHMRPPPQRIERLTTWIGSRTSLAVHTIVFTCSFATSWFGWVSFQTMLLVLTTALSLEAIYLAIFIQMTVNTNTASLRGVEEDIDEIQEDVEEMSEDIDELQEDVEELSEEEKVEEAARAKSRTEDAGRSDRELLEKLSQDVASLVRELEALKKPK